VLRALRTDKLHHSFWFIHEERNQLHHGAPFILEQSARREISALVNRGSLTIVVPSLGAKRAYDDLFETSRTMSMPPRLDMPDEYCGPRSPNDYEAIGFLMVGTTGDGRKGQLLMIAALHEFLLSRAARAPTRYRDFTVTLIGVGEDYVSRQVETIGRSVLGERLRTMPQATRSEVLRIARECNVVVCSSLNESFGLYVAEAMATGHVILRGRTGGMEEQLRQGVNGYEVDTSDPRQFASMIEAILDKETTSNEQLREMGRMSQEIIEPYRHLSYASRLEPASSR
jgi:glycosyltransferase involved in cell wall biosynthesis